MAAAKRKEQQFPRVGTKASRDFFVSWERINRFFNWLLFMAIRMDEMAETAHRTLLEISDDEAEKAQMEDEQKDQKGMLEELKQNRQFLLEVILVRHVENYLNYLSSLLKEIFLERPETLRSSEKIELAYVLKHDSLDDLVKSVAERKVENLSYSSFEDLRGFFDDRFGLILFPDANLPTVAEAFETRNISAHNRCLIDKRYCSRTGTSPTSVGNRRELYKRHLDELVPLLFEAVRALDRSARKKLRLPGIRFAVPVHGGASSWPTSKAPSTDRVSSTDDDAT
jgi:hypothetical protein